MPLLITDHTGGTRSHAGRCFFRAVRSARVDPLASAHTQGFTFHGNTGITEVLTAEDIGDLAEPVRPRGRMRSWFRRPQAAFDASLAAGCNSEVSWLNVAPAAPPPLVTRFGATSDLREWRGYLRPFLIVAQGMRGISGLRP